MTRQSKQAANAVRDKAFSQGRKSGNKGPSKTTPKHGKSKTKWNNPETAKARAAVLGKFHEKHDEKSVLEKINAKKEKKAKQVHVNNETTNTVPVDTTAEILAVKEYVEVVEVNQNEVL